MYSRRSSRTNTMAWFFSLIVILGICVSVIVISGAWFHDIKKGGSHADLTFGSVDLSIDNEELENNSIYNLTFAPMDLLPGSDISAKTLKITNTGTAHVYICFTVSFQLDGVATDKLQLDSNHSLGSWQKIGNKYIYSTDSTNGGAVAANASVTASLKFKVVNLGNDDANKTISVIISARAVQAKNNESTLAAIEWGD